MFFTFFEFIRFVQLSHSLNLVCQDADPGFDDIRYCSQIVWEIVTDLDGAMHLWSDA